MTEPMYLGSFDSEKWLDILGFNGFQTCALCHEVSHPELFAKKNVFAACSWESILSVVTQGSCPQMRIETKSDLKTESIVNFEISCFHQTATKLTRNCVCFRNSCINLFVPPSVTREYHHKLLRYLGILSFFLSR